MGPILDEIDRALDAGFYYFAISIALTIPDICAALNSSNGKTTKPKYKAWYRANLGDLYPNITDEDCWSLRCGVLHQGRFGHPNMQYGRIIFTIPNAQNNVFHNNIFNDALNLDAIRFCHDVVARARIWFDKNQNNIDVKKHFPNLVQFRPQGLKPYLDGIPLIA